ncbi:phosphatidylinositol N-acetylglucosaminyltransferase subunit A-like isoform X2 [Panicum virgatum]|uniref:phosphatidylinositol N-acetylglucosaminyltransferase subunit A-like isoform X2 n=1 Tax=Panicum virgatum TaxID=38727 RepID=UPI0019D67F9E|nr:phosphatidylinositol N-acetylglucosaminyltransferase subunit A-like isoform X2 [Panicum virgatum]
MSAQRPPTGAGEGAGSGPEEESRTPLERAADAAEELYRLRDTFFPQDPAEKAAALRARADAALALLDALPPEQKKSPQQRGIFEFLRGKILGVFPDYHKEAEDHLSKAFSNSMEGTTHRILMVSDFFFPNFGGVESHIYYLSQCLLKLGHKVVVMTHAYGNRSGVRYVTNGLKVYYVPWRPFLMQNTLPTLFLTLPIVRTIIIREKISVVHGHQAFSTLCHEALMHARTMGYKVVFTDHSLYGFADAGSIHMNKVLQFTLADIDQAICVSHTSKENTVLRSGISPEKVFMVPNAVDTAMFTPSPERLSCDEIVIVVISRLVYRKGADLLVEVIPEVCRLFPKVRFIIGGDGPKRVRLEEMREKFSLQDRVEMLGAVPHAQVRSVLISGHIFLNSSLTEAFCIAILEAASCGLLTVSTRVGGVPEVLPDDMIVLAEPAPEDMVRAVKKAIDMLPGIDPQVMHLRMKKLYSWDDVAKRTEIVYDRAMQSSTTNLLDRLPRYLTCGSWAGKLFCIVMIINYLLWRLLEFLQPAEGIEEVPDIGPLHAQLDSRDEHELYDRV